MKKIIGIDIGGTCIKADLYSTEGQSLNNYKEVSTHIDYENKTNDILEQVCNLIRSYTRENEISGVAISSAGVVNSNTGEIIYAGYTIPGYIGTDFTTEINKQFKLPVSVENDVNCAALGEAWLGKAKGIKTAAMITVGTGIGGSIIINGKIFNTRGAS
jgi:ROK family protein